MLEVIDLRKVFKDVVAVNDVNMFLGSGESIGLVGPNGAGKSTTIAMISTLLKPTSGDVKLNGASVLTDPAPMRAVLGVVPQEVALYPELSAQENLEFFGSLYGLRGKKLAEAVGDALELVGLTDRRTDVIKKYSGGMKRRINIAAALLHQPEFVIMDEPTVGIDPQSRNHILETVRTLNRERGLTVLYTSHYMEEVEQLCDRIYVMDHGKVIASGTNAEIKAILAADDTILLQLESRSEQLETRLAAIPAVRQVTTTDDGLKLITSHDKGVLSQVFRAAEAEGANITSLGVQKPSLEDVFLHLTGRTLRD
ncbi:MAG TPA: ABC transporter ATP-binding protein [Trueperaceae bacterium]|nr:ABC transporter ATP-binding protein [Trueperaceae bacterium]